MNSGLNCCMPAVQNSVVLSKGRTEGFVSKPIPLFSLNRRNRWVRRPAGT